MKRAIEILVAVAAIAAVTYWLFGDRLLPAESTGATSAAASAGPGGPGRGNRPATVTLQTVALSSYALTYESIGTIEAEARASVVSETSGRVEAVLVAPGEVIAAGAPLLRLDQRAQELDLATARAAMTEQADALERLERLNASGSSAVSSVQVQEAKTAVELAQVAVDRAEFELDRRTIRAPIGGTVGLVSVSLGDYLSTGTEITTVSEPERLKVSFALPERAVDILEPGLEVRVLLPSRVGQVHRARLTAIDTEVDPVTRLIAVEARLDGDLAGLRHGMIANVVLAQEQPPLPSIPALSISWSRDGASVFVSEGGTARRVPVTIRHRLDDQVWVKAELAEGDRIVVEGVQKVREGGTVQSLELAMAETAGSGAAARKGPENE